MKKAFAFIFLIFFEAHTDPYSLERLNSFYTELSCEQKNITADANVTIPCVSFWVSQNGNDANDGSYESPFLTLERAKFAVSALSDQIFQAQDVYVYIEDGIYRLENPLYFSSSDSGREGHYVIYKAAADAHPVISGAVSISNWELHDVMLNIYKSYVGNVQSRQLYVNGGRRERAKTTLYPPGFLAKWTSGGIEYTSTALNPAFWRDPSLWTNPQNIEAVIMTQWKMMRVPLESTTATPNLITLQEPAWHNANIYYDSMTNLPGEWSFFQATWFENAYEFLTDAGEWYLDRATGWLYYIPLLGENMDEVEVELPLLESLIVGEGTLDSILTNIRFEGLTFSYATWLLPNTSDGYISDQSAQLVIGANHPSNTIGHDQNVVPTPGNISFSFSSNIEFYGNTFEHLGAVGLQFGLGCRNNLVQNNVFSDISSSAIEIGGATINDSHPTDNRYILANHTISNNLIENTGAEYFDSAAIFVGFTQNTQIKNNTISHVPWSAIAIGWGWGLLDVGSFPGLPHATSGEWGFYLTATPNTGCKIMNNRFDSFLEKLWDGGAIYTTGDQGPSLEQGLLIQGNVAFNKRAASGGNVFYTDGGSRHIRIISNASYNNPIGVTFYGPPPQLGDPYFAMYPPYYLENDVPYGSDTGGCVTYGEISYKFNYWLESPIPTLIPIYNDIYHALVGFYPYIGMGFCDVCPFTTDGITYPFNLTYESNVQIASEDDIPNGLISSSGVQ